MFINFLADFTAGREIIGRWMVPYRRDRTICAPPCQHDVFQHWHKLFEMMICKSWACKNAESGNFSPICERILARIGITLPRTLSIYQPMDLNNLGNLDSLEKGPEICNISQTLMQYGRENFTAIPLVNRRKKCLAYLGCF